ncbi:Bcr/CflA family drug resistance efflux transporter [Shewanella sp. OPT22]|nr:Bcr/CflA family drug resistance efflux transporter [Shewanella sp. OPT22]
MRKTSLPILMLLVLLSPLAIDIYLPSMPVMATEFSVSNSDIQSTLVLFLFSMGVGQILIGPLVDRFGRKPVALFGVVLYGLSSLLAAIAYEFNVLLLARVLQGLAACSTSIVAFSAVRDCFTPKESSKIYSYLNGAICVIPALAPSLGGLLAMQFGWRSNFIFMTLFAAVMLLVVVFRFSETKPEGTISHGKLYNLQRFWPVLKEPHFLFYAISCMSAMAAILCYVSYSPVWLIGHLGISELGFSALFGFNALLNIIACFIAPMVSKRLGNHLTVKLAFSLFISTALWVELLQTQTATQFIAPEYAFMLPMILLCVGFALLLGPATSMALAAFGNRAGTATALLGFIQMSGAALICGLIQQTSLPAPDAIAIVCFIAPLGLLLIMQQQKLSHWHQVH